MSIPIPPSKPSFVQRITWVQKILAGITGSMFLMALATMIPWIINMFRPDFLYLLSTLRVAMAGSSLVCGCFVGIPQIKGMIGWLADFYEYYKKFTEFKNKQDKKELNE
jgi:hypothetical protein